MSQIPTTRSLTEKSIMLGVIGIVELTLPIQPGQAESVASFYDNIFQFNTRIIDLPGNDIISNCNESLNGSFSAGNNAMHTHRAVVCYGGLTERSQSLQFIETSDYIPEYNGDHFCIYISNLLEVFERCRQYKLLYVNQRFSTSKEDATTADEVIMTNAFRILNVINLADVQEGEYDRENVLVKEEHEVRSTLHRNFSCDRALLS